MNPVRQILIFFVRVYQKLLSPLKMAVFGPAGGCRFTPSCSQYAVEALQIHGVMKGGVLSVGRICRCHPWGGCGEDPVPQKKFKVQSSKFNVSAETGADALNAKLVIVRPHPGPLPQERVKVSPMRSNGTVAVNVAGGS